MLACLPFILMAAVAAWYGWVNQRAARMVDAHLAWMESVGYPTTMEEWLLPVENPDDDMLRHPAMVAELALPESQRLSTIRLHDHGHRIAGLVERGPSPRRSLGEGLDVRVFFDPVRHDTEAAAARELLEAFAPELERMLEIAEAAKRPQAGWRVEREKIEGVLLLTANDAMAMRNLTSAFSQFAILAMAEGRMETAVRLADATFQMASHLAESPRMTIHSLLAHVSFADWSDIVHEGIVRGAWSGRDLERFMAMTDVSSFDETFIRCLSGEMVHFAETIVQMKDGWGRPELDLLDGWELDREEIMVRLREIWVAARPHGILVTRAVKGNRLFHAEGVLHHGVPRTAYTLNELEDWNDRRGSGLRLHDYCETMFVWALYLAGERHFQIRCDLALLRTGIALELYRLRHGGHPEALEALVPGMLPEVPADPYDGRPLRYRRQADGSPLVWSVGPDRVDGGGRPHRWREMGDRVWVTAPIEGFDERDYTRR